MEVDAAYANFFATTGEAAVLACDELGLVPRDLLYQTKQSFVRDKDDTQNVVLVRYTLAERTRQNNFRKLLAIKNRLIVEGGLGEKWQERCRLFPDAPGVPKISRAAMDRAAMELDTESDNDIDGGGDRIDERGLMKPTPFFGLQGSSTSQENAGKSTAAPSISSSPSPQRARDFLARGTMGDGKFLTHREGDRDVVVRRPKPPPPPPFLPPLPYPRRNSANLAKEEAELEEYRRFLLHFAHETTEIAQECNTFDILYRAKVASDRKAEKILAHTFQSHSYEHEDESGGEGAGYNASRAAKESTRGSSKTDGKTDDNNENVNQIGRSDKLDNQKSRHERQLDAYVRLALLEVTRNSSNYKKWLKFRKEMDGHYPMGTIAAELRGRLNIGCLRSYEDYVRGNEERSERHARAVDHERKMQDDLGAQYEEKHQHAEDNLKKLKNDHGNLFVEVMRMHREIVEQNEEREERRCDMKKQRSRVELEKKRVRAAEHHNKRALTAKEKRYEHDQEEVFRRLLKEKVHEMDTTKKWDPKSVKDMV